MKFRMHLFLLGFFVLMVCGLGSVSANEIIDDVNGETNPSISHDLKFIQNSIIHNTLTHTDTTIIDQGTGNSAYETFVSGGIYRSEIYNTFTDSSHTYTQQGHYRGFIENSQVNNEVTRSSNCEINQGSWMGDVRDSVLNNKVDYNKGSLYINQNDEIWSSELNNQVMGLSGESIIYQGYLHNSYLNNFVAGSNDISIRQSCIFNNCKINNVILFSSNTSIEEGALSNVNGRVIAFGCHDYSVSIKDKTNINFYRLIINNKEIGFAFAKRKMGIVT